jgi:hypothetical protein
MMKNQVLFAAALALTFTAVACGSSSSTDSTSTTSSTSGGGGAGGNGSGGAGGSGPKAPAASCTQAGDKGNENGIGTFCTPGGGECGMFPKAGLCLADVGQDQWFCTRIGCKTDDDCGSAAHCHLDNAGAGCVPDKCEEATSSASSTGTSGTSTGTGTSTGAGGSK